MYRTQHVRRLCSLVLALSVWGCDTEDSADGGSAPSAALDASVDASVPSARPEGWDALSHEADAATDYARIFPEDRVQRLDIRIAPEQRQQMLDDLTMLIGQPGSGGASGGAPGGGAPGGMIPEAGFSACMGLTAGAACTFAGGGSCASIGGERLFCLPSSFMGAGRGPGGGGGAIDLIGGDPVSVPVTIGYDGRTWNHVAMRYKGNSSLSGAWRSGVRKLGFRIDFDKLEDEFPEIKNQRFFGFGELTFSSGYADASLVRDKLAGELLRDFGLKTARCAFYRVFVDVGAGPEYWGVYTMIEDPSDQMLDAQFADGSGNLYKPDGTGADFTRFDMAGFEKKTNEKEANYQDVMAAIGALHAPRDDAARWRSGLEAAFDVDTFLSTIALSRAIGHWDGYGVMSHNYYLYGDPQQKGRLTWLSWDHNMTWPGSSGGLGAFSSASPMMDEVTERWPLIRYLLDDPIYRERYRVQLARALEGSYLKAKFEARAAALHALVAPYVLGGAGEPGELAPYTNLASPETFRTALSDPKNGLFPLADALRAKVTEALAAGAKPASAAPAP